MDIPDIPRPANNVQGIGSVLLLAEAAWVSTWAVPTGNTNFGDDSIITGDHVFSSGKGFRKIYIGNRTSKLIADYIGGQDTRGVKPKVEAFMPGINPVTTTFFAANKGYLLLVPSINCASTRFIQLGSSCRNAEIPPDTVKMGTGMAEGNEESGHNFVIDWFGDKIYYYEGDTPLYGA